MKCLCAIGVLALVLAGCSLTAASELKVPLTVTERLGIERVGELVTSGIPLPEGAFENPDMFRLLDEKGETVPAHFSAATRWWPGKSIKWLHLDFACSVAAKSSREYILETAASAAPLKTPLSIEKQQGRYVVNTGPLRFVVKAKGFNLFDEVWLEGKQLVGPHSGGIVINTAQGSFSPANFPDTTITIEEQSPMKVVLLVAGRNVAENGSGYAMDARIRIYAYANSPLVKVVYTVENRRGKWAEHIDVADWKIMLPTRLGANLKYRFGLADRDVVGVLTGNAAARLDVLATDLYGFSGIASGEGNPHAERPPRMGALDLTGAVGGVTVAVKNFWQMWSKYLAADAQGNLAVGLWTDRVRDKGLTTFVDEKGRCQFYAGVGRTHEIFLRFHKPDEADPIACVAPAWEPLFARCQPYWYCRGTRVFGELTEADLDIYAPEWRQAAQRLNEWAEQAVREPHQRWRTKRSGKVDSYGMLNYGDGVEEINGTAPEKVHWEGGYYDYMHSVILNFARTGDLYYLWLANDQSRHNAEVHHTHHDQYPGHSRYCPSYAHIIMPGRGYYASGTFNHWKNLSAFERWYLLGDHRARESALEITEWAMKLGNDGIDFGQPRSICHGILGFYAGWDATGEKKYLDALTSFARATARKLETQKMGSGAWQRGMALQGLCRYVEVTGDESVLPMIRKHLERDIASGSSELAYACVFMWKRTKDPKYFYAAVRHLGGGAEVWMQRFGNHGRSKLYVPAIVLKDVVPTPLPPK